MSKKRKKLADEAGQRVMSCTIFSSRDGQHKPVTVLGDLLPKRA